jgi:PKD repeat protein
MEYNPGMDFAGCIPEYHFNDGSGALNSGVSWWWDQGVNPASRWLKIEMAIRWSPSSDGYINVWENGVSKVRFTGRNDWGSGGVRSETVGGYQRSSASTDYRYFSDIYLDYTLQRVILANNATLASATVREVQIPSAWSDSSITVSVNLASFTSGTAYLFVFDATGAANSTGFPITVDGGSPVVVPNAAFTASPTNGQSPLLVNFTDQSTDSPTAWSWIFGSNSTPATSTTQNPSTTYSAGGSKTVSLTVSNSAGTDPTPATTSIPVRYLKPTNFQAN